MRRRSRRIPRLVILSLILAHLTTWAVAWGAAWIAARDDVPMRFSSPVLLTTLLSSHAEVYRETVPVAAVSIQNIDGPYGVREARRSSPHHMHQRWGIESENWRTRVKRKVESERHEGKSGARYGEYATGWPWLSHMCWSTEPDHFVHDEKIRGGIPFRYPSDMIVGKYEPPFRALPYLPIYRGLIINTIFYTLLWLLLLFFTSRTTRAYKHRARTARGLCPNCKYDLNGITHPICPECGTTSSAPSPSGGGGAGRGCLGGGEVTGEGF